MPRLACIRLAILQAMAVYRSGRGVRGAGSWEPSQVVLDALDGAFYKAFSNVEPTGKRHLIALDVSGSMGAQFGGTVLTCREATAALALVTMAVEPVTHVVGFTSAGHHLRRFGGMHGGGSAELTPLKISPKQRLTDAVAAVSGLPFGGTDCALPMLYALEKRLPGRCLRGDDGQRDLGWKNPPGRGAPGLPQDDGHSRRSWSWSA